MERNRNLLLGSAVVAALSAASPLVLAADVLPDAKVLGTTEAIFDYCAKVDPAGADVFHNQSHMVAQGASDESLQKVRKSDEYRVARDATEESLAKVDPADAVKVCMQNRQQGQ